MFDVKVPEKWR